MALFTGKGDDGTTSFFGSGGKRCNKDHPLTEALGTVDELDSFLGLCKAELKRTDLSVGDRAFTDIIEEVQQNLFIIQAELAGADKTIVNEKVEKVSELVNQIEGKMPPIKSFFVPGATEQSARLDVARAISRRVERRVVALTDEHKPAEFSRAYLNRLSSLLYALARLAAHRAGVAETPPTYE